MEVDASWASLIVGVATAAVLAAGHVLARRGQKEQAEQQRAANNLAAVERQRDRAESAEVRERDRADRERDRADKAEDECDELRRSHRRDFDALEAGCRRAFAELTGIVHALRKVVVNEVEAEAARMALEAVSRHPHENPDPTED